MSPHPHALSLALSIEGVLGSGALRRSLSPADIFPNCSAEISESSLGLPPLQAGLLRQLLCWRSPRAPSYDGTLHTGAPPDVVDRADYISALWQLIVGNPFNLGHPHIQASLLQMLLCWGSLRAPSAGGTLHTGTHSQRSRPVVSPAVALFYSAPSGKSVVPPDLLIAGKFLSSKLYSHSNQEAPNYQKHIHNNLLLDALESQNLRSIFPLVQWRVSHMGEVVLRWGPVEQVTCEYILLRNIYNPCIIVVSL